MSNKQHKHILLNASGCLTQMACRHYSHNKLNEEHKAFVESHIQSCELCRDSLEGYGILTANGAYTDKSGKSLLNLEKNINQLAQQYKHKHSGKQRRLIYFTGLAASLVIGLAVLVTIRYDQFFSDHALAENTAEKIPIDQLNTDLALYEGHFKAPAVEITDTPRENLAPATNEKTGNRPDVVQSSEAENRISDNSGTEISDPTIVLEDEQQLTGEISVREPENETARMAEEVVVTDYGLAFHSASAANEEASSPKKGSDKENISPPSFRNIQGTQEFKKYIRDEYEKMNTDEKLSDDIKGVKVIAVVNENGEMRDIEIRNTLDTNQEQAIRNIILKSPAWQPAISAGRPTEYTVQVSF
ncbi:MAG: hypothetical protein GVY19_13205 [Bacteroidetes bacterium]|jgi:hypothetical protein|nr:hypothetical protein [Bacteroidota bacterium]